MPSPPLRAVPPDQPSASARPDEPVDPPPATLPAPPAAAAAASAPPVAAASSSPSQMSADDVTRTLASLADLRDRGAISAEEYEAKKADLLRRL
jgi:anti-sigma factor RsiW